VTCLCTLFLHDALPFSPGFFGYFLRYPHKPGEALATAIPLCFWDTCPTTVERSAATLHVGPSRTVWSGLLIYRWRTGARAGTWGGSASGSATCRCRPRTGGSPCRRTVDRPRRSVRRPGRPLRPVWPPPPRGC